MAFGIVDDLNPRQREAVEFGIGRTGDAPSRPGPLLVVAGAGSGKTKTLSCRVANLLLNGADPGRILLLTFTRRAAAEMIRRAEGIVAAGLSDKRSGAAPTIAWAGTFHAVGARLLRMWAATIGLEPGFSILDRADAEDLLDLVRGDQGLAKGKNRFPKKGTCLDIYSNAVNSQKPLDQVLAKHFPWCVDWEPDLKTLFRAFVEAKQRQAVLDYDDLLLWWARMMEEPAIAAIVGDQFDHVLVDEYQDTNALQASILIRMKPDGAGMVAVGDDAQSIYSFRAATVRNILDFPTMFSRPAHVVTLEQNYRSTQAILDACNAVIGHAKERHSKNLFADRPGGAKPRLATVADETAEVEHVVGRVLANLDEGMSLRQQAVLFRASHHSAQLELELTRRRIPYRKFGGLKFLEAAHVKDLLSILRFAENPRDQAAGLRVLKLVPGIGSTTARKALAAVDAGDGLAALQSFAAPANARAPWAGLAATLRDLSAATEWPGQVALARCWYDPILEAVYDDVAARKSDIEQLERLSAIHGSRQKFLTELALDPPDATGAEAQAPFLEEDWLTLSTIHSAKGQEWRSVFILSVVDGCIPSDLATGCQADIEEERRLLYVAMTRARDQLTLLHPLRFHVRGQSRFGDRHVFAPRTRFIPPGDIRFFDLTGGTLLGGNPEAPPTPSVAKIDLGARVKDMWA
ncbi:ATP-dependent helicase [Telmatospirillum sp.]|uniref:ATP-dependent helicase n=1 Tax=Telmatospirillum sp. TaxID=2079197 RepID=UPI002840031A|nr:ATP-dependent helicase [Telmatospirillum sp.]MDR3437318.1 ATP-dependent helicase [Telmatospirillum sp.]